MNRRQERWKERDAKGARFTKGPRCDCCGKPTGNDYETDSRICGNSDGPGFTLCSRKRCIAKRDKAEASGGLDALRALYTAGHATKGTP